MLFYYFSRPVTLLQPGSKRSKGQVYECTQALLSHLENAYKALQVKLIYDFLKFPLCTLSFNQSCNSVNKLSSKRYDTLLTYNTCPRKVRTLLQAVYERSVQANSTE